MAWHRPVSSLSGARRPYPRLDHHHRRGPAGHHHPQLVPTGHRRPGRCALPALGGRHRPTHRPTTRAGAPAGSASAAGTSQHRRRRPSSRLAHRHRSPHPRLRRVRGAVLASVVLLALTPLLPAPPPGVTSNTDRHVPLHPRHHARDGAGTQPFLGLHRLPQAAACKPEPHRRRPGGPVLRAHPPGAGAFAPAGHRRWEGFAGALGPGLPLLADARGWTSTTLGLLLAGAGAAAAALTLATTPTPPAGRGLDLRQR